jgi:hypothetical protein
MGITREKNNHYNAALRLAIRKPGEKRHIDCPLPRPILSCYAPPSGVIRLPYTSLHSTILSVDRNIGSYNYMAALASYKRFGLVYRTRRGWRGKQQQTECVASSPPFTGFLSVASV